jgi:hypothetical protein
MKTIKKSSMTEAELAVYNECYEMNKNKGVIENLCHTRAQRKVAEFRSQGYEKANLGSTFFTKHL